MAHEISLDVTRAQEIAHGHRKPGVVHLDALSRNSENAIHLGNRHQMQRRMKDLQELDCFCGVSEWEIAKDRARNERSSRITQYLHNELKGGAELGVIRAVMLAR
jgi:hypothetical protein